MVCEYIPNSDKMIPKEIFSFLGELKSNNTKEWFDSQRHTYEKLKIAFESFIDMLISEISVFDRDATQTTARTSIFRINRDTRFSNNKDPYKTNMGAFIANGGRKSTFAGYYVHIEPGECMFAGGIYMPAPPVLKAIRQEIYENPEEFEALIKSPVFTKYFGTSLYGEKLKSAPQGFPKDFHYIDLLKYKNYTVARNLPDQILSGSDSLKQASDTFQAMAPFNTFLNQALRKS